MRVLLDHGRSENLGDAAMVGGAVALLQQAGATQIALTDHGLWQAPFWSDSAVEALPLYQIAAHRDPFLHAQPGKQGQGKAGGLGRLWPLVRFPVTWPLVAAARAWQRRQYARTITALPDPARLVVQLATGETLPLLEWCDQFDAGVIGGGIITDDFPASLFRQYALARAFQMLQKPFCILGVQYGPFHQSSIRQIASTAFRQSAMWSVREPVLDVQPSPKVVRDMSVHMMAGDPEPLLNRVGLRPGQYIAFQVRVSFYAAGLRRYIPRLAAILQTLHEHTGLPLLHIPISLRETDDDRVWGQRLMQHLPADSYRSLDQLTLGDTAAVRAVFAAAHGVAATSYHACQFALTQGTPAVCMYGDAHYAHKATGLCRLYHDDRLALCLTTESVQDAGTALAAVFADAALRSRLAEQPADDVVALLRAALQCRDAVHNEVLHSSS